jgi:hypothetical protein
MKRIIPTILPDGSVDLLAVYALRRYAQVHHIDGDPMNNAIDNLQFFDARENRKPAQNHGSGT